MAISLPTDHNFPKLVSVIFIIWGIIFQNREIATDLQASIWDI